MSYRERKRVRLDRERGSERRDEALRLRIVAGMEEASMYPSDGACKTKSGIKKVGRGRAGRRGEGGQW